MGPPHQHSARGTTGARPRPARGTAGPCSAQVERAGARGALGGASLGRGPVATSRSGEGRTGHRLAPYDRTPVGAQARRAQEVNPMKVLVPAESRPGENRVALVPESIGRLTALGPDGRRPDRCRAAQPRDRRRLPPGRRRGDRHRARRRGPGRHRRGRHGPAAAPQGRRAAQAGRDHACRSSSRCGPVHRGGGRQRRGHGAVLRPGPAHLAGAVDGRPDLPVAGLGVPRRAGRRPPACPSSSRCS